MLILVLILIGNPSIEWQANWEEQKYKDHYTELAQQDGILTIIYFVEVLFLPDFSLFLFFTSINLAKTKKTM